MSQVYLVAPRTPKACHAPREDGIMIIIIIMPFVVEPHGTFCASRSSRRARLFPRISFCLSVAPAHARVHERVGRLSPVSQEDANHDFGGDGVNGWSWMEYRKVFMGNNLGDPFLEMLLVHTIDAIGLALDYLTSCPNAICELFEHRDRVIPVNAGVCDRDTRLE